MYSTTSTPRHLSLAMPMPRCLSYSLPRTHASDLLLTPSRTRRLPLVLSPMLPHRRVGTLAHNCASAFGPFALCSLMTFHRHTHRHPRHNSPGANAWRSNQGHMAKEGRKVEAGGGPLDHPPIAPGVGLTNFLPVGKTHGVAGGTHPAGHLALSKGWSYETP